MARIQIVPETAHAKASDVRNAVFRPMGEKN
jgi:hypothetical protein